VSCGEEEALHESEDSTVGLSVIDGRSYDEGISGLHLLGDYTADVILEDASTAFVPVASATVDAHANRLAAYLNDFGIYAVFLQRRLYLLQAAEGVAVSPGTAVDEKDFALLACCRIEHGGNG